MKKRNDLAKGLAGEPRCRDGFASKTESESFEPQLCDKKQRDRAVSAHPFAAQAAAMKRARF